MTIYYIYAYLRQNGTPYYIGKGSGQRAWKKHQHRIYLPKDPSRIVLMETNLTELGAFALERRYIRWWGRKDLGTGILQNKTDGGEGTPGGPKTQQHRQRIGDANRGRKLPPVSAETREKLSKAGKGQEFSPERRKNIGEAIKASYWSKSPEYRAQRSESMKGRTLSPETIAKRTASRLANALAKKQEH